MFEVEVDDFFRECVDRVNVKKLELFKLFIFVYFNVVFVRFFKYWVFVSISGIEIWYFYNSKKGRKVVFIF